MQLLLELSVHMANLGQQGQDVRAEQKQKQMHNKKERKRRRVTQLNSS